MRARASTRGCELGADETIDYRDATAVAALEGTADVALSLAAGSRGAALRAVRPSGVLIGRGAGAGTEIAAQAEGAGVRYAATHVHTQREWLERVVALAASGDLVPRVSASFALTEAAAAHRALEQGHTTGKIVLTR